MLRSLDIKNVAVIENLNIEFKSGLTVLTGETGAGKSIIIDSINMILGSRTNKTLVRYGASKAFVSAFFDADKRFDALFEDWGIQQEDGIIISRSMSADGKSIARINGVMVPLNVLRDIAASLVNIHGQQDNQAILNDSEHIGFLDEYAGCAELLSDYGEKYAQARDLKKRLDALKTDEEEKLRRIKKPIKVAVMGCAVNGPGEAREADVGIAGGDGCGIIFRHGEILRKVKENELVSELMKEIDK